MFVLQTMLSGLTALERRRLALLFDSASGELVRGIRAWREVRCAGGRFAELAELEQPHAQRRARRNMGGRKASSFHRLPVVGSRRPQPPSAALTCAQLPSTARSRALEREREMQFSRWKTSAL